MDFQVQGVHVNVTDELKEFIEKKLHKIEFAQPYIVDLNFKIIKDNRLYKIEATINFQWGHNAFISIEGFDVYEEFDKLVDKIDQKVKKEKSKIKDH